MFVYVSYFKNVNWIFTFELFKEFADFAQTTPTKYFMTYSKGGSPFIHNKLFTKPDIL